MGKPPGAPQGGRGHLWEVRVALVNLEWDCFGVGVLVPRPCWSWCLGPWTRIDVAERWCSGGARLSRALAGRDRASRRAELRLAELLMWLRAYLNRRVPVSRRALS
jgi:hypothetical protein